MMPGATESAPGGGIRSLCASLAPAINLSEESAQRDVERGDDLLDVVERNVDLPSLDLSHVGAADLRPRGECLLRYSPLVPKPADSLPKHLSRVFHARRVSRAPLESHVLYGHALYSPLQFPQIAQRRATLVEDIQQ